MAHTPNGGPAFPFYRPEMRAAGGRVTRAHDEQDGMSLRDYFAAKALTGITAKGMNDGTQWDTGYVDTVAALSYRYADAMLRARAQPAELSPAERQATKGE